MIVKNEKKEIEKSPPAKRESNGIRKGHKDVPFSFIVGKADRNGLRLRRIRAADGG